MQEGKRSGRSKSDCIGSHRRGEELIYPLVMRWVEVVMKQWYPQEFRRMAQHPMKK